MSRDEDCTQKLGFQSKLFSLDENTQMSSLHRARKKNIPNINDCHSKKGLPILIIFGINISGTTGHQMIGHFIALPNVCFCTTWGKLNHQNMG